MEIREIKREIQRLLTAGYPAVAIFNPIHEGYGFSKIVKSVEEFDKAIGELGKSSDLEDTWKLSSLEDYNVTIQPLIKGKTYRWDEYYDDSPSGLCYTSLEEATDLIKV